MNYTRIKKKTQTFHFRSSINYNNFKLFLLIPSITENFADNGGTET